MITYLRIQNFALAENSAVEFGDGLNVITGETGAGKSILIGALGLLLGNRADKSVIRTGETTCSVEAVFSLKNPAVINTILAQYGMPPCDEDQLIIRRNIRTEGAGQNWVNGGPVTLQILKQMGDRLVDIHGPHDHQSLLQNDEQLKILDSFGHLQKERKPYDDAFRRMKEIDRHIAELSGDTTDLAGQIDFLSYRVKEIKDAGLQVEEEVELEQEHLLLGNTQRIQELGGNALGLLTENEDGAFDQLTSVRQSIDGLTPFWPAAKGWLEECDAIIRQVQELGTVLSSELSDMSHSPDRLLWLDDRIALYQNMKRKYACDVAGILKSGEEAEAALRDLETRGDRLTTWKKDRLRTEKELTEAALELRKKRKASAKKMSQAIQKELQALGLKNSSFDVTFRETEPHLNGMDAIDFEFSPNAGEKKSTLSHIASSGEVSRVMLAIKTVLAGHDLIPVLIFDEIDSNVGGETARTVGAKLKEVAANHQVICITHFPQVAVYGARHLAVEKEERNGRTHSIVRYLEKEERVDEIARMLGGKELTSMTLDHAREMLQSGQN